MNNNELLTAISDMLDEKLNKVLDEKLNKAFDAHDEKISKKFDAYDKKISKKFDAYDKKISKKFDAYDKKISKMFDAHDKKLNLSFDEKLNKAFDEKLAPIYKRLDTLENHVLQIQITQENDVLPRLQTIEDCYLSTFKRYEESCDKIDQMQKDIAVHALVLEEHSEILKRIS